MSMLGLLAGLGDAARAHNEKQDREKARRRDSFAEDLRRVMESEDWPEQARAAAAQMRFELFSNPKIKDKDYEKMWGRLSEASRRPGSPSAEQSAAASSIPALQSLREQIAPIAPAQDSLTMRPEPGATSLDLLRPAGGPDPVMGDLSGASQRFNLRPPAPQEGLVAPRSMAGAVVDDQLSQTRRIAAAPVPQVIGPYTRAEKNQFAMEDFRQRQAMGLDTFEKQQQIADKYARDKWVFGGDGQIALNQATGDIKQTGYAPPPKLGDMTLEERFVEAEIQTAKASGVNVDDPRQFQGVMANARRKWAELGRDPDTDAMRMLQFQSMQDFREYRAQQDLINNAEQLQQVYNKAKENASASIRYANALKAAVAQASLGGDLGVIFSAMRMLDPGSVVREQEYRVGQSLGGPWHNFIGKINQLRGVGLLDDFTRKEFDQLADMMIQQAEADYSLINNHYMKIADARRLPHDMVGFGGPSTYVPGSTPAAVTGYQRRNPTGPPAGATAPPPGPGQTAVPTSAPKGPAPGTFAAAVAKFLSE